MGKIVTVICFTYSAVALKNLPIYNVLYAYDTIDVTNIMLEHNNTIYIGDQMEYSLGNPIQL